MNPVRALFPKARRPVTAAALAPLVIFIVLFAGACFLAEWRGWLRFSYRPAFAFTVVLPWIWWLHHAGGGGLTRGRALFALITRFLMIGAFIVLLAEPRAVRKSDTLSLIYALDVSDSMGSKVRDQALGWIMQTATQKPVKDEAGLVVFGNDAAVELPPRQSFPFEAINSRVARDGTDLGKALSLAAAMLPEEHQGRIVLLTDGNETEGSVVSQLDELKSRGIAVDVLPVGFNYEKEVWIERLDLPRVVKAGETYEATVLMSALSAGHGKLRLSENGKSIFEKEVDYEAGKNRFTLPLYLREPGYYEYAASIEVAPGEDGWKENNLALGDIYLRGEGQVLVVTDARSDARDWEPLVAALKASERIVQVRMGYEIPRDATSLLPYDLIIFANAPADAFDAPQLQAVRDAVYNLGTGFIMLGSPNSFGPGGYHRTAIEEALPVEMDVRQKKILPKGALAVILHTCEFPEGNTWAKRMAKEAMRVLGTQDDVGLIAYAWGAGNNVGYNWIFPLTPAAEYEKLAPLINKAEPGDMPDFQTPMQMALKGLQENDAALKHLIVISDGDPSPPTPALIQEFVDSKISVSMIAINPHGGRDISIMQAISQQTGGRYYFPQDPAQLPAIFIKEAKTLKRSMLQNKVFTPEVAFPSPILKGIDATPQLRGYVLTTVKPRASTVLRVPPLPEEPDQLDPLLVTWRFGLGAAAAWTSDLGAAWAQDWIGWEKYRAFVKQLSQEVSRVEQKNDLRLNTFAAGGNGVISVEDFAQADAFLEIMARVTGPRGETLEIPLRQNGPRRYQGQFPLSGKGRYQVVAVAAGRPGNDNNKPEQIMGSFAVPYSPEYLRFQSNPILLQQIASRTGGRILSGADLDIYHPPRQTRESTRPIFDWVLIVLACLLPLDVAVRRVQLDWTVIRGWFGFGRAAKESTETMGALLGRKKRVQATMEQPVEPRAPLPVTRKSPPAVPPTPQAPHPTAASSAPAEDPQAPLSTTERLLARKRKRDQDQK